MDKELKTILVTGCTSGIGKATCIELLENNFRVIGIGRNEQKASDLISNYDKKFKFYCVDLSMIEDLKIFFSKIYNEGYILHGMVLCAGSEETLPFSMYKPSKISSIMSLNVLAQIEMIRLYSRKKISADNSSIVVLSSVMSILGQPGKVGYCTSKSALLGLVKSVALELSTRKINVNAISPGVVDTPMTRSLFEKLNEENINKIKEMHPLGIGYTKDIVGIISFLLSPKARWITGQNIVVDGGYSIA